MKLFDKLIKQPLYMNKTVIHFTTHGCMGTDHRFDWIGKIVGITYPKHCQGSMFYKVKVLKDQSGESRDNRVINEFEEVPSWYLQNLGGDFYIAYD